MQSMRIVCLLVLHVSVSLTACARTGGSVRSGAELSRLSTSDNSVASRQEMPSTCRRIEQTISAEINEMKDLLKAAKSEQDAPPTTLVNAWQRAFGGDGNGIPALQRFGRKREAVDILNAELKTRGCEVVDIDAKLATQ